jgi:hypothetical protein
MGPAGGGTAQCPASCSLKIPVLPSGAPRREAGAGLTAGQKGVMAMNARNQGWLQASGGPVCVLPPLGDAGRHDAQRGEPCDYMGLQAARRRAVQEKWFAMPPRLSGALKGLRWARARGQRNGFCQETIWGQSPPRAPVRKGHREKNPAANPFTKPHLDRE